MKKNDHSDSIPPVCSGKRVAVVVARFYDEIAQALCVGARRGFGDCGIAPNDIKTYWVPGSFELPIACRNLIRTQRFDALVALGAVVRGQTPHFEFVATQCARGIMDVQLATGVPIGFGVLTTDTLEQAQERADPARGDKGYEAAVAAATVLALVPAV